MSEGISRYYGGIVAEELSDCVKEVRLGLDGVAGRAVYDENYLAHLKHLSKASYHVMRVAPEALEDKLNALMGLPDTALKIAERIRSVGWGNGSVTKTARHLSRDVGSALSLLPSGKGFVKQSYGFIVQAAQLSEAHEPDYSALAYIDAANLALNQKSVKWARKAHDSAKRAYEVADALLIMQKAIRIRMEAAHFVSYHLPFGAELYDASEILLDQSPDSIHSYGAMLGSVRGAQIAYKKFNTPEWAVAWLESSVRFLGFAKEHDIQNSRERADSARKCCRYQKQSRAIQSAYYALKDMGASDNPSAMWLAGNCAWDMADLSQGRKRAKWKRLAVAVYRSSGINDSLTQSRIRSVKE